MPKPLPSFVIEVSDLLSPLGEVRVKRMFGGFGIYVNELFMAIIVDEQLFVKVDDETRPTFESRGLEPFTFEHRGKMMSMAYHQVPEAALTSSIRMKPWATLAIQAAKRAAGRKR